MRNETVHNGGGLYLNSYYFCIITMTTIGFGDIVPVSFYEKVIAKIIWIIRNKIYYFCFTAVCMRDVCDIKCSYGIFGEFYWEYSWGNEEIKGIIPATSCWS